jgi:hypothetical protein
MRVVDVVHELGWGQDCMYCENGYYLMWHDENELLVVVECAWRRGRAQVQVDLLPMIDIYSNDLSSRIKTC